MAVLRLLLKGNGRSWATRLGLQPGLASSAAPGRQRHNHCNQAPQLHVSLRNSPLNPPCCTVPPQAQAQQLDALFERRKQQFGAVAACIEEVHSTIEAEAPPEEGALAAGAPGGAQEGGGEEAAGGAGQQQQQGPGTGRGPAPMQLG